MNIQTILKKLNESGLNDAQIGREIGASASIINRLRHGKHSSTSFERGQKIQSLFEKNISD